MNENYNLLEHLKLIQQVISRLAQNSFLIKGWMITLWAVLLSINLSDGRYRLIISIFLSIPFWLLDAYFLKTEREYRNLYKYISENNQSLVGNYSLEVRTEDKKCYLKTLFSKTLLIFYSVPFLSHCLLNIIKDFC